MSIAAIVAAALAAAVAPAAPAAPAASRIPPIVVDLATVTNVSSSIVSIAIEETQALFRAAGIRFIWRRNERSFGALRVVITTEPGPTRDGSTPLGWVLFENGEPSREIHLSYDNAQRFMELSQEVVGIVRHKTIAERDTAAGTCVGSSARA